MPLELMRKVCRPGAAATPRILIASSLRTTELRSRACDSQRMPSATVKIGVLCISSSLYSPTRNDVVCQLVRCMRELLQKVLQLELAARSAQQPCERSTLRNESTITMAGLTSVTCWTMVSSTVLRSP